MVEQPFTDDGTEDAAQWRVLMEYCPRCGTRLYINEGIKGNVYWCPKEKKDVTDDVVRAHKQSLDPASTETARVFKVEFPAELRRFSWAAFLFNWIWAFARGLPAWGIGILLTQILFAVLIPVAILVLPLIGTGALVFYIWFGFAANSLDWKKNEYRTADEFRSSHRRWEAFMKIFGVLMLLFIIGAVILITMNMN